MKKIEIESKFHKNIEEHAFGLMKTRAVSFYPLAQATVKDDKLMLIAVENKEKPNTGGVSFAMNKEGKMMTMDEVTKMHGKDVFSAKTAVIEGRVMGKPATITPNVNNLILSLCDKFGEKLIVDIPKNPIRIVDIYFLADTTGSMGDAVNTVQSNITSIMNTVSLDPTLNLAFGAGNYKDFNASDPYCFQNDVSISPANNAAVTAAVNTWVASGGGDGPEGQLFALTKVTDLATIGWRPNSLRIVVWFGDFPGHDPICPNVSLQVISPITEATTTTALTDPNKKIRVLAISVNGTGLDNDPNAGARDYAAPCTPAGTAGQGTRIANATGGSHQSGVIASNIANAITTMIQNTLATIGNVSLVPSSQIKPFICSINPKLGYSNLDTKVDHRLEFVVCFRGVIPCKSKDQLFKGTIDVVLDGNIVVSKKVIIEVPSCKSKGKCHCNCCD